MLALMTMASSMMTMASAIKTMASTLMIMAGELVTTASALMTMASELMTTASVLMTTASVLMITTLMRTKSALMTTACSFFFTENFQISSYISLCKIKITLTWEKGVQVSKIQGKEKPVCTNLVTLFFEKSNRKYFLYINVTFFKNISHRYNKITVTNCDPRINDKDNQSNVFFKGLCKCVKKWLLTPRSIEWLRAVLYCGELDSAQYHTAGNLTLRSIIMRGVNLEKIE